MKRKRNRRELQGEGGKGPRSGKSLDTPEDPLCALTWRGLFKLLVAAAASSRGREENKVGGRKEKITRQKS